MRNAPLRDGSANSTTVVVTVTSRASVPGHSPPPQRLSMQVTVYTTAVAVAATSSFERTEARVYLGERASLRFVARDVDGLRLDHGEADRFSANFTHAETGAGVATSINYAFDGAYSVTATPVRLGEHRLRIVLDGRQSLPSVMRIDVICQSGSYAREGRCENCPLEGAVCADGSTLQTIEIEPGFWRISNSSLDLRRCPQPERCVGTANSSAAAVSLCINGTAGALCDSCDGDYYASGDLCLPCSGAGDQITSYTAVIAFGGAAVALGLVACYIYRRRSTARTWTHTLRRSRRLVEWAHRERRSRGEVCESMSQSMSIKLKIAV
eukprot:5179328-Prymnesium_polylepis.1